MENKQEILNLLLKALQATRAGYDVTALKYDVDEEAVYVDFLSGPNARRINVAMDSGIAMIRDVLKCIDIG